MKNLEKYLIFFYIVLLVLNVCDVPFIKAISISYLGFLPIVYLIMGLFFSKNALNSEPEPKHIFWGLLSSCLFALFQITLLFQLMNWYGSTTLLTISFISYLSIFLVIKQSETLFFKIMFWRYIIFGLPMFISLFL
ncbi:MAG: hypothetical protein ACPG6V_06055 [Flavobacteriales bacterium]